MLMNTTFLEDSFLIKWQSREEAVDIMRKGLNGMRKDEAAETILNMFAHTKNNREFISMIIRKRML